MPTMTVEDAARAFLANDRIAVAGVSRTGDSPGNGIAERLKASGHTVFRVNPNADTIDGERCYPSVDAIEGGVDAVVSVTEKSHAGEVADQAVRAGAEWIWYHQGFGPVSFTDDAVKQAREAGLKVIAVGCPMMYDTPDVGHACIKTCFKWVGRIPKSIEV
jgi:predicted CoA-binding protein